MALNIWIVSSIPTDASGNQASFIKQASDKFASL